MRRAVVLVLVAAGLAVPHTSSAGTGRGEPNPLEGARDAAAHIPFSGEVKVNWRDVEGLHTKLVHVRGRDGAFVVEGQRKAMALGKARLVSGAERWRQLWPSALDAHDHGDLPPGYHVSETGDGRQVAGFTPKQVEVSKGGVRERLLLHKQSGFLLAREQYDSDGKTLEQSFEFTTITLPDPDVRLPEQPTASNDAPERPEEAPKGMPRRLGEDYRFVAAYRPDGVTQAVYGDGFYDVSLFRERGRLEDEDLPSPRRATEHSGRRYWEFAWPGGQGVIWAADSSVYTLVGDAPSDELLLVAASVPAYGSTSIAHRLRQACRGLVETFTGGT